MMMPVGYFKCFSCNHTWMPGVPEEPLVKLGKDSWVDFPDHKGICQVGYNYDEHVQWFVFAEDKFLLVDWFIQSSPVKGEFGDGETFPSEPKKQELKRRILDRMTAKDMVDAISDGCDLPNLADIIIDLFPEEEILTMTPKEGTKRGG